MSKQTWKPDPVHVYSAKWERAVKDKRYHDALALAIRGYLAARDLDDLAFETACLAYMANAIKNLTGASREQRTKSGNQREACSFCGKGEKEARIMGGADANICEECATKIYRFFRKKNQVRP
jgi:hypothetical protein